MMPLIPFALVLLLNARVLQVNLHCQVRGGHRDSWTMVQDLPKEEPIREEKVINNISILLILLDLAIYLSNYTWLLK